MEGPKMTPYLKGDTFQKPIIFGIYVRFREPAVDVFFQTQLITHSEWRDGFLEAERTGENGRNSDLQYTITVHQLSGMF